MEKHYKLVAHQKRFLLSDKPTVVLNCGRSSGKSFIASLIAALRVKEGKKILVWAQDFKALSENLLSEIIKRLDEMHVIYHYNQNAHKITCGKGIIYGLSYENIEACRGFTEIGIAICDEIALAPANFFGTMAFCMRGKGISPKIYCMTTPRVGTWWNDFVRKADPDKIEIIRGNMMSLLDKDIITQGTLDLVKATCLDENMLRQELYGELVEDNSTGVLFTSRLLTTAPKFLQRNNEGYAIGIDCSGLGKDSNVIVVRNQNEILDIVEKKIASNSELCSTVRGLIMTHGKANLSHIAIDEAYGLDLHERLTEANINAVLVPFGGKAKNSAYANQRAEMYINMKKGIEEFGLKGITDELSIELHATKYILNNNNKIQLIPKDEIKMNIGRSPDIADALALTYTQDIIPLGLIEADRELQNRYML